MAQATAVSPSSLPFYCFHGFQEIQPTKYKQIFQFYWDCTKNIDKNGRVL
jgi:hypothetical protein